MQDCQVCERVGEHGKGQEEITHKGVKITLCVDCLGMQDEIQEELDEVAALSKETPIE